MLRIAWASLMNRKFAAFLCVFSIALSTALFLGIDRVRDQSQKAFLNSISGVDLIVGARGGPLNLVLYSVFHLGSPIPNMSYSSYQEITSLPNVRWAIPWSLGDSYQGFRVVGTSDAFFEHMRLPQNTSIQFRQGRGFDKINEAVLGSQVATRFSHQVGERIQLAHGTSAQSAYQHSQHPFVISGILESTGTPLDRAVFISLEGMEAIHIGWETGTPNPEAIKSFENLDPADLTPNAITAMFVKTTTPIMNLQLQRYLTQWPQEPLTAVLPGLTLQELWGLMDHAERALKLISILVFMIALVAVMIALLSSLDQRSREFSLLRVVGLSPLKLAFLSLFEAWILAIAGLGLGVLLTQLGLWLAGTWVDTWVDASALAAITTGNFRQFLLLMASILTASTLIAVYPAWKAFRGSLAGQFNR